MKRLLILSALAVVIPLSAMADQFGIMYGFMTSPSGSTKLYSNGSDESLVTSRPTTGFFLGLENLRVGYLDYQLMASAGGGTSYPAKRVVDVQILSFEYQRVFPGGFYYHAGLANFASQFHWHYTNTSNWYSLDVRGRTTKLLDPGFIGGAGFKFEYGKGFLGADFTLIPGKTVTYEYDLYANATDFHSDGVDVGATIIGILAGMNF